MSKSFVHVYTKLCGVDTHHVDKAQHVYTYEKHNTALVYGENYGLFLASIDLIEPFNEKDTVPSNINVDIEFCREKSPVSGDRVMFYKNGDMIKNYPKNSPFAQGISNQIFPKS